MNFTKVFEQISTHLDPILVNDQYKEKIKTLCNHFPPLSWAALECRLVAEKNQVDFMLSFSRLELEGLLKNEKAAWPNWVKKRMNLLTQIRNNQFLNDLLDCIWLEYDINLEALEYDFKPPLFFLVFKSWPYDFQLLSALIEQPISKATSIEHKTLKTSLYLIEHLPNEIQLYAIGFMESRNEKLLRMVFKTQQYASMRNYLQKINWAGDVHQFEMQVGALIKQADSFLFHLNVGHKIQLQLGLELCLDNEMRLEKLNVLLHQLVERKLCTKYKKNAILDWNGSSLISGIDEKENFEFWNRYVNYIKLNYDPQKALEVKTYLFYKKRQIN